MALVSVDRGKSGSLDLVSTNQDLVDRMAAMTQLGDSVWARYWEQADRGARGVDDAVDSAPPALDADASGLVAAPRDPWEPPRRGDTVLVLGEHLEEGCVRAAADVGSEGRVIGIDHSDDVLARCRARLRARSHQIGRDNSSIHKARFEDLRLDRERVNRWLRDHPVQHDFDLLALEAAIEAFRTEQPVVGDASVDVVIARGLLSRLTPASARATLPELFRVLRRGGRVLLSGMVSDEEVPGALPADPVRSAAGITGGVREDVVLAALAEASFYGIQIVERSANPALVVEGVEFRELVVVAYKGKEGPCWECNQAVIYRGPFKRVEDDDGHVLYRGVRMAVCEKTFRILSRQPYRDHVELVEPAVAIAVESASPFPCSDDPMIREARAQKGTAATRSTASDPVKASRSGGTSCGPGSSCCA
jgi:arsenite methyltransferase